MIIRINTWRHGMVTLIPDDAIAAVNVTYKNDAIRVELDNGRVVTAPLDFLPLIKNNVKERDLKDIHLIDGGTGVMFGDGEAVSIVTILGLDKGYKVCKAWRQDDGESKIFNLVHQPVK